MSLRVPNHANTVAAIHLAIAAVLIISAVVLLTTIDEAVQRTRAAMDLDPMLDSVHYRDYIESIVNYRHVVAAGAFVVAAISCATIGAIGLTGRLRTSAASWIVWGIAGAAFCIFVYGERTGFALRANFNYELVQRYTSRNEASLARAAQILGCFCLLVLLPLSTLWRSINRRQGTTSATSS